MRIKVTKVQNFIFSEFYFYPRNLHPWFWLRTLRPFDSRLQLSKYFWRFENEEISFQKIQVSEEDPMGEWKDWTGETFPPHFENVTKPLVCKGYKFKTRVPKVTITVIMVIIRASSLSISTSKRPFTKLDRVVFLHVMGFGWVSWTNGNRLNRMEKDWRKRENQRNGQRFFLSLKEKEIGRKRKKLRGRLGKRSAWTH